MPTHQEIEAQLTGPGAPFEIVEETVLGERTPVFKERARSLRALLESSAGFGDREYLVHGDLRLSFAQHARVVASVAKALRRALRDREGRPGGDPRGQLPRVDRLVLGRALARRDRGRAQRLVGGRRDRLRTRGLGSEAADRRLQAAGADRGAAPRAFPVVEIESGLREALEPRSRRRAAGRSRSTRTTPPRSCTPAARPAGPRAPSTRTATSSRSAGCRCSTACGT